LAIASRRRWPALLLAAPYGRELAANSMRWRRRAPIAAAGELAADIVGAAALIAGSLRARTPVL